jgi:protein TonB
MQSIHSPTRRSPLGSAHAILSAYRESFDDRWRWQRGPGHLRRLPWLFVVLLVHGLLLTLFLRPHAAAPPLTEATPLQTSIIDEPRQLPAPPRPKPVTIVPIRMAIEVPQPFIINPDPTPIAGTFRSAQAAVAAPAAPSATVAPGPPVTPPSFDAAYLHNPTPQYPIQSLRLREQGTALLRVEVSPSGSALQVLIEHTSGPARLGAGGSCPPSRDP